MPIDSGHARYHLTPEICCAPRCNAPVAEFSAVEVPLCQPHHIKAEAAMMEHLSNRPPRSSRRGDVLGQEPVLCTDSVVYYVRFSDRVKIGTTHDLKKRLIVIPHDEVMATEPGGLVLEHQRHVQFAHLRVHREWFRLTPELTDHIATVKVRQAA